MITTIIINIIIITTAVIVIRVKSRLEKERPERVEPFMKGAQVN